MASDRPMTSPDVEAARNFPTQTKQITAHILNAELCSQKNPWILLNLSLVETDIYPIHPPQIKISTEKW